MRRGAVLVIVVLIALAGCGDNGGDTADAAKADAFAFPDGAPCAPRGGRANRVDVFSGLVELELSGAGSRCEQAIAALPQLADPLPDFARLLANDHTTTCEDFDTQLIVRLGPPPEVAGARFVAFSWLVEVVVLSPTNDAVVQGSFYEIVELPTSCNGEVEIRERLPGHTLDYVETQGCLQTGLGQYTITVGDGYRTRETLLVLNPDPVGPTASLSRYLDLAVYLLPAHVTESIRFSDLNCCTTPSLVDCVGARLLVSTVDGDVAEQSKLCTCAP